MASLFGRLFTNQSHDVLFHFKFGLRSIFTLLFYLHSIFTILSYLTNLERIRLNACPITPQTLIKLESLPWKNKIERFYITNIDEIFDVKLFIKFLQKAMAPYAELLLHFLDLHDDKEGRENYSEEIEEEITATWMHMRGRPYITLLSGDDLGNMGTIEDAFIPEFYLYH